MLDRLHTVPGSTLCRECLHMSVYFFFTSTDKPVTKENVTVFQYSRKMSGNKSKFTPQNFIRRKTI